MSIESYNPSDPEFMASRSLNEELSKDEQRLLDETLASSDALRAEADYLRKVDALVKSMAEDKVELDWHTYTRLVQARVAEEHDALRDKRLDTLLAEWSGPGVEVDQEAFAAAVMAQVEARGSRARPRNLLFRVGLPLAAAALLALSVTAVLWSQAERSPVNIVHLSSQLTVADAADAATSDLVVSFRRRPPEDYSVEMDSCGISYMTVGAIPFSDGYAEAAPPM